MELDINILSGIEFENVCKQIVENMGFDVETTKLSGDGGIDLIAYNHQPLLSGKYIVQCKRYSGSVGEPIIRDLFGVVMSERANKGILMTTGYFTKSAIAFAKDKQIELIDGAMLKELLKNNNISVKMDSFTKRKKANWEIDNGNSDDENFYNYHMQLLREHPDELLYQLTFLEVAVSRLYSEVWNEGNDYIQDIIDDFYDVISRVGLDNVDENTRYSIMFLTTPVLLFEKRFDELICKYYELLKWNTMINSVKDCTGLDETYFTVVHNLVQVLLIQGRVEEANCILKKHRDVINNQLELFEGQIDYDDYDDVTERYERLKNATLSNTISYFFFCEYACATVTIGDMDAKKITVENHYSHIYSDCVERNNGYFSFENETFWNEIYIIKEDGRYFLETYQNGNVEFF